MRYWLTTHWPHPLDQSVDWDILLQSDARHPSREPAANDRVLFFELMTGKQRIDGQRRAKGRRGIVASARVLAPLQEWPEARREDYTDGTSMHWQWYAPCGDHDWEGFVDWREVNRILDYQPKYTMLGFGDGSGLGEISQPQFDELLRIFKVTPRE